MNLQRRVVDRALIGLSLLILSSPPIATYSQGTGACTSFDPLKLTYGGVAVFDCNGNFAVLTPKRARD